MDAILGAALELAGEGLDLATTNKIAKRAGVGVASLYRYFPDKESIFAEIARRHQQGLLERLRGELGDDVELRDGIRAAVRVLINADRSDHAVRRSLIIDIPPRWYHSVTRGVIDEAVELLTEWVGARLVAPPADLARRIRIAHGITRGAAVHTLLEPDLAPDFRPDAIEEWLVQEIAGLVQSPGEVFHSGDR